MLHLKFQPCLADPYIWMRPIKKSNVSPCYKYVLLYKYDVLVISDNGEKVLRDGIGNYFELKESSIGPPNQYHVSAWSFSSSRYVTEAVKNIERQLEKNNFKLPRKAETPLQTSYRPEIDTTPELSPTDAAYYQSLIVMIQWMFELGIVYICLEVSMMSSHLALPREGNLGQLYNIFAHIKKYYNTEMVFDPTVPEINELDFEQKDWTASEFGHIKVQEDKPFNMPEARGMGFTMRTKVEADHSGESITMISRTGYLVYLNISLVYWLSKKHISVESSPFGSEFCAMKLCCEYIHGLRYNLLMMDIPVNGPAYVYGDNQSVLFNTSIPNSTLKKKSHIIAYHFTREGATRDEWITAYVNTNDNKSELPTKQLPACDNRRGFVRNLLYHIYSLVGLSSCGWV